MRFVVQAACKYGCEEHAEGQWYDKKRHTFRNPIKAWFAFRKIKKENWKSKYRLIIK